MKNTLLVLGGAALAFLLLKRKKVQSVVEEYIVTEQPADIPVLETEGQPVSQLVTVKDGVVKVRYTYIGGGDKELTLEAVGTEKSQTIAVPHGASTVYFDILQMPEELVYGTKTLIANGNIL